METRSFGVQTEAAAEAASPAAADGVDNASVAVEALVEWQKLAPKNGGGGILPVETIVEIGAHTFEAALAAAAGKGGKEGGWQACLMHVLLKRESGGKRKDMAASREALWSVLDGCRRHAPKSAAAALFATLCGVQAVPFVETRASRVLLVLRQLYPSETTQRVRRELRNDSAIARLHGGTDNLTLVLRSLASDLGGADAVGKLIDALTDAAAPDPTADDPTCLALPLAQALLLVVAHHDAQRATSAANLRGVFAAFDANGDGCLDLDEFQALIGACGVQPGDDEKGRKMFMDCAKASRKIRRSVGDAILPEAFVAVCEKHGIEMAIKPTVAVSGGAL